MTKYIQGTRIQGKGRVQGVDQVLFEGQGYRARIGLRVLTKYYSSY